MTDENKNVENKQEENKTGKNRLKVKIKNIFLIFLVIFLLIVITCFFKVKTNVEEEETLYTFKDSIQNFFINREIGNKPGKWVRLKGKLSTERRRVKAHLLPDGNVIIFGGTGLRFKENTVDIYSPKEDKVIKTVQICNDPYFRSSSYYNTISLKNGDVFLAYYIVTRKDNEKKNKTTSVAKIFDSKTYTFRDVTLKEAGAEQFLFVLLKDGNILMLSNSTRPNYIYNPNTDEYFEFPQEIEHFFINGIFSLDNGDIILFYGDERYIYKYKERKIVKYKDIPKQGKIIQLDANKYLIIQFHIDHSTGYIYDIKQNKKYPVKNKIDKTSGSDTTFPLCVLLENKDVLLLGINTEKKTGKIKTKKQDKKRKKYTSYMYDYDKNIFRKISNPPFPVSTLSGVVKLNNGDLLFIHEKDIQVYKTNY